MYCPNCGKENSAEQRFCRSCGLGLQTISQAFVNELDAPKSNDDAVEVVGREGKSWHNPLLYGFLLLLLGITIVIFGKKLVFEQLVADIGTLVALLGIGLLAYKGVSLIRSPSDSSTQAKTQAKPLPEGLPTTELPAAQPASLAAGEPPSITEHTTRHFEPVYTKRKAE